MRINCLNVFIVSMKYIYLYQVSHNFRVHLQICFKLYQYNLQPYYNASEISDTHIHIDKRSFYKYLNAFVSCYNAVI